MTQKPPVYTVGHAGTDAFNGCIPFIQKHERGRSAQDHHQYACLADPGPGDTGIAGPFGRAVITVPGARPVRAAIVSETSAAASPGKQMH